MVGSLILFVLVIIMYITITDVVAILFRLTGMSEERARFQSISLLTNSGYTTQESEDVVASTRRRTLARFTMLFGYTFTVTIVSTTVNFFMSLRDSEVTSLLVQLPLWGAVLAAFWLIRRNARFKTWFDSIIERLGNRLMFGKHVNRVILMESYGEMVIAHIYLYTVPACLQGVTLAESGVRRTHNMLVMMVKSPNGNVCQAGASTILQPHDVIIVLGNLHDIRKVFEEDSETF